MHEENNDTSFDQNERKLFQKEDNRRNQLLRLLKFLSTIAQPVLFALVWAPCYAAKMKDIYLWRGNLAIAVLYGVLLLLLTRLYRGFEIGNLDRLEIFLSHALAQFITNCLFYLLSFFLCERLVSPLPLLGLQCVEMLLMYLWTVLAERVYRKYSRRKKLAVIYRDADDLERVDRLKSFLRDYEITEKIQLLSYSDSQAETLFGAGVEAAVIVGVDATTRNGVLKACVQKQIPLFIFPKIGDVLLRGVEVKICSGELLFQANRTALNPEYLLAKRAFDIFASLCMLVLTSPIILITALAIKLEDGGPVFYRQVRLTANAKPFSIFKFRSMRVDAEKDGRARLASVHDDRITKTGRFIRACRIDELPQLLNILRGDMTIVGPRPERPEIAAEYEKVLPEFALRLQVKAGLTGYAQIYGRYNSEPYEKLQMDLMYISKMSAVEDLRLMFGTIRILFSKESTDGFREEKSTVQF